MHKCKLCLCCGCSSSYYLKSKCQIFLSKILPHFTLKIHFAAQLTLLFVFTKISFFLLQLLLLTFHDYPLFISFIWICIQQLVLYVCCKYYAFIIVTCHYRRISNNEMFLSSCGNNKIAYLTNNFWDYYLLLVWQSFHPPFTLLSAGTQRQKHLIFTNRFTIMHTLPMVLRREKNHFSSKKYHFQRFHPKTITNKLIRHLLPKNTI